MNALECTLRKERKKLEYTKVYFWYHYRVSISFLRNGFVKNLKKNFYELIFQFFFLLENIFTDFIESHGENIDRYFMYDSIKKKRAILNGFYVT